TGSTNWTNDSWTREENVILKIPSAALAAEYARNFAELWDTGRVDGSGKYDLAGVPVDYQGSPVKAHVFFAPGRGRQMAHVIAQGIAHARRRIRVCSPVITAGVILGTLGDLAHRPHPDFKGVYDRSQMAEVLGQWRVDPHATWKGPAFQAVSAAFPFASKVTTPYTPTSVHDFMHAKITVVDNTVFTGSYNLSHAGEDNAENLLQLDGASLADRFVEFVDTVYARYAPARPLSQNRGHGTPSSRRAVRRFATVLRGSPDAAEPGCRWASQLAHARRDVRAGGRHPAPRLRRQSAALGTRPIMVAPGRGHSGPQRGAL